MKLGKLKETSKYDQKGKEVFYEYINYSVVNPGSVTVADISLGETCDGSEYTIAGTAYTKPTYSYLPTKITSVYMDGIMTKLQYNIKDIEYNDRKLVSSETMTGSRGSNNLLRTTYRYTSDFFPKNMCDRSTVHLYREYEVCMKRCKDLSGGGMCMDECEDEYKLASKQNSDNYYKCLDKYEEIYKKAKVMVEGNMLSYLVEKATIKKLAKDWWKDWWMTDLEAVSYKVSGNQILVDKRGIYNLKEPQIGSWFDHVNWNSIGTKLDEDARYSYDKQGNISESIGPDGVSHCYLWGYNGLYPIAYLTNVKYSEIIRILSQSFIDGLLEKEPDMSKINALRIQFPEAQVTTYTYEPLVGMTSMTSPSGITSYYVYDSFNRLKEIYTYTNNKKEIIESYDYNYSNKQL